MKKVSFILIAIFALSFGAKAQNALGLRLGAGSASNVEISYQMQRSNANRLEFDLGWNNFVDKDNDSWTNISLSGTYQWVFPIISNLNWYVGPGAMLSFYDISRSGNDSDHFGIGVGGQIGIEYTFDIPLTLSLDMRPMWNFIGYTKNWGGIALGVRYRF